MKQLLMISLDLVHRACRRQSAAWIPSANACFCGAVIFLGSSLNVASQPHVLHATQPAKYDNSFYPLGFLFDPSDEKFFFSGTTGDFTYWAEIFPDGTVAQAVKSPEFFQLWEREDRFIVSDLLESLPFELNTVRIAEVDKSSLTTLSGLEIQMDDGFQLAFRDHTGLLSFSDELVFSRFDFGGSNPGSEVLQFGALNLDGSLKWAWVHNNLEVLNELSWQILKMEDATHVSWLSYDNERPTMQNLHSVRLSTGDGSILNQRRFTIDHTIDLDPFDSYSMDSLGFDNEGRFRIYANTVEDLFFGMWTGDGEPLFRVKVPGASTIAIRDEFSSMNELVSFPDPNGDEVIGINSFEVFGDGTFSMSADIAIVDIESTSVMKALRISGDNLNAFISSIWTWGDNLLIHLVDMNSNDVLLHLTDDLDYINAVQMNREHFVLGFDGQNPFYFSTGSDNPKMVVLKDCLSKRIRGLTQVPAIFQGHDKEKLPEL